MDTSAITIRFEKLVSLNIEGIASKKENLELWNILRRHPNLKDEFLQVRNIHYLLTVGDDPSASQMAFAARFKDASRTRGLKGKNFLGSRRNRLVKVAQKKKKMQYVYPTLKIAASLLIMLGCVVLCKNIFFQTETRFAKMPKPDETYLAWSRESEILELKRRLEMLYGAPTPPTYLSAGSENEIIKHRKRINEIIDRSKTLWPWESDSN